jgi:uncharacterized protein (TIGR02246 family)
LRIVYANTKGALTQETRQASLNSSLFAEDAILYDPFGQVYEGRDTIQQFYQNLFDAGFNEISIEIIEIEVLNDTAYEIASYTVTNDEDEAVAGYHMVILTRENDEWRRHRVIANMAMPEEEMNN